MVRTASPLFVDGPIHVPNLDPQYNPEKPVFIGLQPND